RGVDLRRSGVRAAGRRGGDRRDRGLRRPRPGERPGPGAAARRTPRRGRRTRSRPAATPDPLGRARDAMILCVAPSPAWDVTYGVDRFREHATNRAHTVSARAGGKAVNVARVLHALGEEVTVVAPVGGPSGELFAADLSACGIP